MSKGLPFGQVEERKFTNKIFTRLHLKILTSITRQGKDFNTRNKETNVSLFADTWRTCDSQ